MYKALSSIVAAFALAFSTAPHAAGVKPDLGASDARQDATYAENAMSHGEIRKIDAAAGKLTIKHGPLDNLGMGAMTMVFKVNDPAMLSQVQVGDRIDFVANEVNGALTVTRLRKR